MGLGVVLPPLPATLDLCCNGMTGVIPDSITKLNKLRFLSLSDNYLHGTLPDAIGYMAALCVRSQPSATHAVAP